MQNSPLVVKGVSILQTAEISDSLSLIKSILNSLIVLTATSIAAGNYK